MYFPVEPSICLFVYNLSCTISRLLQDAFQGALETFIIVTVTTNLKTFGGCPFGYITPTVWNSPLADLRNSPSLQTFKAKLKTHLFHQAFWLICACLLLPVSYPFLCVRACECACVHACACIVCPCACVCMCACGWVSYGHRHLCLNTVSVHHSASVSTFKSSLKTFLFKKLFFSPIALIYDSVCVCAPACMSAFMFYALNFDNMYM